MFDIIFENEKGEKGLIGVMVMVHGDNKGLVLPPKVAPVQVIVIPVPFKDADTQAICDVCTKTAEEMNKAGFRAEADMRDNYSPGVPLRIEMGPKDMAKNQDISRTNLDDQIINLPDNVQQSLFKPTGLTGTESTS
ncbi:hypothetical protein MKX03_008430 [Papaver bracteatum]|nr:hypothetical protein MKX03_008430 [Papaver bracteatum]